ncbi:hypothetical protein MHM83_00540 [Tenacibaculum sp. Mcav3-52]|uniref:Uncharacterized protein n=2 Tax=Tenacibaculum TaxID=104267 RepID=A0ABM7CHW2_9FLAO|nr:MULTISPECIES: hypothetical protein [Tenacibaculum]AZJ33374.1 hypothetical protein D6200_12695 [Tenacibaculum mesophilum]KAF9659621.1 hypothetical protein HBA12_05095 [Tenacibaculum mesophilum]MCG7500350.1 hypothetical protein [Tenacibaculum sp. Mcav3-52]MCO7184583.1 hypothetical protein [Tenacibaculum sp. XPcli2-G]QFS28617.1 hypothetical protein F9Y86_09520 [Tenacibaculum mesophilum]
MVNLNEYLGGIATSIAEARLMSDLKSLEIAEKFSRHELLKHFSIPRFKAQNIELTIPVAIGELEETYEADYEPIDNVAFNSQAYTILKDASKITSFDRKTSTMLRSIIAQRTDELEKNIKATGEVDPVLSRFSQQLSKEFISIYSEKVSYDVLVKKLNSELRPSIKSRQITQKNTKVIVEAHKLNEIKPENIVQIKMTLNEEGMEWYTSENEDGVRETKLLPE